MPVCAQPEPHKMALGPCCIAFGFANACGEYRFAVVGTSSAD